MSTESSPNWPVVEPPPFLPARRRRWPFVLVMVVILALAGAGAAYVWLNPGLFIQSAGREAGDGSSANDGAVMTDLLAAQQKTADDLAAIDRAVADQQEQIKAVVRQLADLSSKIDTLKSPAPPVPIAPSPFPGPAVGTPQASVPPVAPAPTAHIAPRQKKKPPHVTTPTSTGPISVGGAPLPATPDATVR